MSRYFDRDGKPITLEQFEVLFQDHDYRVVAADQFGPILISTVWLGLNHSFDDGAPRIFESMVFGHGGDEEIQQRYATLEEARRGHAEIVERYSVIERIGALARDG